jgi:hypothetical protein
MPALDERFCLDPMGKNHRQMIACEAVLADGLKEFLSELMMVNGGVMVSYICNNQHAHLDDIIGSSTERRIKPGRLHYGSHAQVDFDWGEAPSVSLAMELRDDHLTAFFRVVFGSDHIGIDLSGIHFSEAVDDPDEAVLRFSAAVADARLD